MQRILNYLHNVCLLKLHFTFTECAKTVSNSCKSFYFLSIMSICCRLFFVERYNCTVPKGVGKNNKTFCFKPLKLMIPKNLLSSYKNVWIKTTIPKIHTKDNHSRWVYSLQLSVWCNL
jgi:hypothetical protein